MFDMDGISRDTRWAVPILKSHFRETHFGTIVRRYFVLQMLLRIDVGLAVGYRNNITVKMKIYYIYHILRLKKTRCRHDFGSLSETQSDRVRYLDFYLL